MTGRILHADVLDGLALLPDQSVHCVVTSPPFWSLRDNGTAFWQGGNPLHSPVLFLSSNKEIDPMCLSRSALLKRFPVALTRFDGAAMWARLGAEHQARIGAIALELFVNQVGEDLHGFGGEPTVESRPFEAAASLLNDMLTVAISDRLEAAVPEMIEALSDDASPVPLPSLLGPICRLCGCSEQDACEEGCHWVEPELCSARIDA